MKLSIAKKASKAAVNELINYRERRQLENAIYRVYVPFSHQHEQWVNKLFDFSFLVGNGFNVLARAAKDVDLVTSNDLTQAWADQFGFDSEHQSALIEEASGVAKEFLKAFRQEFEYNQAIRLKTDAATTLNKARVPTESKLAAV
ncbi:MAG: hypothetical protein OER96_02325 [Gammaproteobacteria bacterium]|nr:hypothetical protein [Gammaproteobacteria bacterium]